MMPYRQSPTDMVLRPGTVWEKRRRRIKLVLGRIGKSRNVFLVALISWGLAFSPLLVLHMWYGYVATILALQTYVVSVCAMTRSTRRPTTNGGGPG